MLRGTLTTFRRRCGKPNCRCATGEPHESPALAFTDGGRTKTLTLTAAEVTEVAAALARYEQARAELDEADRDPPWAHPPLTVRDRSEPLFGDRVTAHRRPKSRSDPHFPRSGHLLVRCRSRG